MNLPIESFIPSGAGLLGTLIGLAGIWFKVQNKVENLEKEDSEQGRQINALWMWKDGHEKEAAQNRESINRELFKLEGANMVVNEQFKQILAMLEDIKERISELEKK